ncbi:hypothetical protein TNCV_2093601 [Trichonephila clavipes]|nr:hypothetical protein TNCV_2093601 [Trichonephila clavipes]
MSSLVVRASDETGRPGFYARCLRVHTEYVLVKSVGLKVLWVVATETTSAGKWRLFPSPPVPSLNCRGGDRWCRHLLKNLSFLREFHRVKSYCHLYGGQGQRQAYF